MKIARIGAILTLAGALAVPALQAQQGPPPRRGGAAMMGPRHGPGPGRGIVFILEHREDLELTDEQVTALEALDAEAREFREARADRIRALRGEQAEGRAALRERMTELREAMRKEREAHRERVRALLTDEQGDRLWELAPGERPGRRGRSLRPRGGGRRGGAGG